MKKIILTLVSFLVISVLTIAQHGSPEQKSAFRTVADIEKKMLAEKSDTTAVRLIKDHKKAKMVMQKRLHTIDGYGKIKKDKPSIDKFKLKAVRKDSRFAAMDKREKIADKAKKDYISSINPRYKAALPTAFPKN